MVLIMYIVNNLLIYYHLTKPSVCCVRLCDRASMYANTSIVWMTCADKWHQLFLAFNILPINIISVVLPFTFTVLFCL